MSAFLNRFYRGMAGVTPIECALIIALVAVVITAGVRLVGTVSPSPNTVIAVGGP